MEEGERMSRYIDADDYFNKIISAKSAMACIEKLHSMPKADVVPVVRCADCKYMDDSWHTDGFDGICRYWNSHSTDYSWFCSNGKKVDE